MSTRAGHLDHPPCAARQYGMDTATFYWHATRAAWIDDTMPLRYRWERGMFGKRKVRIGAYALDTCPWCAGDLPLGDDRTARVLAATPT